MHNESLMVFDGQWGHIRVFNNIYFECIVLYHTNNCMENYQVKAWCIGCLLLTK